MKNLLTILKCNIIHILLNILKCNNICIFSNTTSNIFSNTTRLLFAYNYKTLSFKFKRENDWRYNFFRNFRKWKNYKSDFILSHVYISILQYVPYTSNFGPPPHPMTLPPLSITLFQFFSNILILLCFISLKWKKMEKF